MAERPGIWSRLRRWLGPAVGLVLVGLAAYALIRAFSGTDWPSVGRALVERLDARLALVPVLLAVSYLCFAAYDHLASRILDRPLSWPRAALLAVIAQGLSLNVGNSLVVGGAVRLRMLTAWGWSALAAGGQTVLCFLCANLGAATAFGWCWLLAPPRPESVAMALAAAAAAVGPAWVSVARGPWLERLALPGLASPLRRSGMVVLGIAEKLSAAALLVLLLPGLADLGLSPATFLACFLAAVVVGKFSQVPGGLGVVEGTFLAVLPAMPTGDVLAGTLAGLLLWRIAYYLLPLVVAGVLLAWSEVRLDRSLGPGTVPP